MVSMRFACSPHSPRLLAVYETWIGEAVLICLAALVIILLCRICSFMRITYLHCGGGIRKTWTC